MTVSQTVPSAFRGQYFFGYPPAKLPENFLTLAIKGERTFFCDKSLPHGVQRRDHLTGILAGHVFDPSNPRWDLDEILADLLKNEVSEIVQRTSRLAGRWILLLLSDEQEIAIGDACGSLPVTHLHRAGQTWLAASSLLLNFCLGGSLQTNELATGEFSTLQARPINYSGLHFPATMTEYLGVGVLLPNHLLDLKTGVIERFHPCERYEQSPVEDVARRVADMMTNLVLSISLRHPLAVAVTAGFDSRVLVGAVSKVEGLAEKTCFFTFQDPYDTTPGHFDINIGRKLSEMAGGSHREIEVRPAEEPTRKIFQQFESMRAPRFENWAARCLAEPFPDRMVLMGWASEIARAYIRWPGSDEVTADQIAGCAGVRDLQFTRNEFARWHAEATKVRKKFGINILDLFYWEVRAGRWCSSGFNIFNSASDWITIYSCRDMLDLMLCVDEKERSGSRQRLYREIVNNLNPALMQVPFNPTPFWKRLRRAALERTKLLLVKSAKAVGIYELLRGWKHRFTH